MHRAIFPSFSCRTHKWALTSHGVRVMAPPPSGGVPSVIGDDGDMRGVWGSTRDLHLKVGAHLRESRAARSDERYKNFIAYAKRREEEREDAPRAERDVSRGQLQSDAPDENNQKDANRASPRKQKKADADGSSTQIKSPTQVNINPRRVGGGYKVGDKGVVDDDAPRDPRTKRMPKPEPIQKWRDVALELRNSSSGGEVGKMNNQSSQSHQDQQDSDPTLLMLRAVEKAAHTLGVRRTGVWTALGKPYAIEGPPTTTPPRDIRSSFPTRTKHPDQVEAEKIQEREDARAGIVSKRKEKWTKTLAHQSAAEAAELAEAQQEKDSPLRDILEKQMGFRGEFEEEVIDGMRMPTGLDARQSFKERKFKGRFSREALEASAQRVRQAKHGGGS